MNAKIAKLLYQAKIKSIILYFCWSVFASFFNLKALTQKIVSKYSKREGDKLLPFVLPQNYNEAIKLVLYRANITRQVVILDPQTRSEKKVSIASIAASHLARRTFTGLLYKQVKDPNLVGSLTGHVEGSRAFVRYRNIDEDMKRDLVKKLEI